MVSHRKQAAINEEDYDAAKAIKAEIAKVRTGGVSPPVNEVPAYVEARTSNNHATEAELTPGPTPAGVSPFPSTFRKPVCQSRSFSLGSCTTGR